MLKNNASQLLEDDEFDVTEEPEAAVVKKPLRVVPTTLEEIQRVKEFVELPNVMSASKSALFNEGFGNGFRAAVDDYGNERVDLDIFTTEKTQDDMNDFYQLGFDAGYMRKLAELLVY